MLPDDYNGEFSDAGRDPPGLYIIIMVLICLLFWGALFKAEGWI